MIPQLPKTSSAGQISSVREVAGFILTETAYCRGFRAPYHSHEFGFFFTVLEGAFSETLVARHQDHHPFSLAYRPTGLEHSHSSGSGGRCFNIYPVGSERLGDCADALRSPVDVWGPLLPWLVRRLYREFSRLEEASPLVMEGLALEILGEAVRPGEFSSSPRPSRRLKAVRELLDARFAESLTVAEVAQSVGINPAYLSRLFREHYRCTIGEYVRRLRVEFACRLLCTSDAPLATIALDAGFVDQSHFTRTFKLLTGMTPARFRSASRSV